MWTYNYSDEIFHYGRKGMKWYQNIFSKNKTGSNSKTGKKTGDKKFIEEEHTKAAYKATKSAAKKAVNSAKKKDFKKMSDEELKSKIERLKLEENYLDLKNSTASKATSKGKSFALKCIERVGENVIVNLGTQAANHIIGNAINKMAKVSSEDVAKRVVNPQKGQSDKK